MTSLEAKFSSYSDPYLTELVSDGIEEMKRRGLVMTQEKLDEYQKGLKKSLSDFISGHTVPLKMDMTMVGTSGLTILDSITPIIDRIVKHQERVTAMMPKFILPDYDPPTIEDYYDTGRIKELQKILHKHPNRHDARQELLKLQKTLPTAIGRPKRKKKR